MRKQAIAALMFASCLSSCGITGKLDAVSHLEASRASYKRCLEKREAGVNCELQKARYESDIMDAARTRGTLTDWRWL